MSVEKNAPPDLLNLLHAEAVERGQINPHASLDLARAFYLVRDMPYERASSRDPETIIREWQGTCSGKHYLLKALFEALGHHARVMACSTVELIDPDHVPAELGAILAETGGRFVDIHNYLVLEYPGGEMIVDATWPLSVTPIRVKLP